MCLLFGLKHTFRLEIVAFCHVLILPSNQDINIDTTVALEEHLCHELASETTDMTVQATILHHLLTLPPNKWVKIEIFAAIDTSSVIFKLSSHRI